MHISESSATILDVILVKLLNFYFVKAKPQVKMNGRPVVFFSMLAKF